MLKRFNITLTQKSSMLGPVGVLFTSRRKYFNLFLLLMLQNHIMWCVGTFNRTSLSLNSVNSKKKKRKIRDPKHSLEVLLCCGLVGFRINEKQSFKAPLLKVKYLNNEKTLAIIK